MTSAPRRAVLMACWLIIAALLIRIAVADGTFSRIGNPPTALAIAAIATGAALVGCVPILAIGFAAGSGWAVRLSRFGTLTAIALGLALVVGRHESGSVIAAAAFVGLAIAAGSASGHDRTA